jgi:nucleoid DNA-binding protein
MRYRELLTSISKKAGITENQAEKVIDIYLHTIKGELKKGQKIKLANFGTFAITRDSSPKSTTKAVKAKSVAKAAKRTSAKVPQFHGRELNIEVGDSIKFIPDENLIKVLK